MGLEETLEAGAKAAMLGWNELVRDTLRMVLADFKRIAVQEGGTLTSQIEQDVPRKATKQR